MIWLAATLGAYLLGQVIHRALGRAALANPVLIAILLVGGALLATNTAYPAYFDQARLLHMLLAPTTVALAIPLADNIHHIRRHAGRILLAVLAGAASSAVAGIVLVRLAGGSREVAMSMAPKSATSPIAMAIADQIGGAPALAAVFAILGGIVTAIAVGPVLRLLRLRDWDALGLAAGTAGSGIAAASVTPLHPRAAAFAGLAIGLNGLATALLAPLLAPLLARLF